MITHDELKRLLHYNPETGVFTRLTDTGTRWKAGKTAGSIDRSDNPTAGYAKIFLDGKRYKSHRLAWLYMTGEWPDAIDHVNHDRSDNRWCNLREVSHATNTKNRSPNRNNNSGFRGVIWYGYNGSNKWMAYINTQPKMRKNLGYFDTLIDAVAARLRAECEADYHENHGVKV